MKARKIPVEEEVIQLTWGNWNQVCDFIGQDAFKAGSIGVYVDRQTGKISDSNIDGEIGLVLRTYPTEPHIDFLSGILIRENDWIVKDYRGQFHTYKPDVFLKIYELVNEQTK
jgi:hypothetical protein